MLLVRKMIIFKYIFFFQNIIPLAYRCCNVGSMNVDIGAETSKLHAKEEKNSMRAKLIGIFSIAR